MEAALVRVRLGIGEREGDAPAAAHDAVPGADARRAAQRLQIAHQRLGGVADQPAAGLTGAAAPLVHQDDPPELGVKKPPVRTTMQM